MVAVLKAIIKALYLGYKMAVSGYRTRLTGLPGPINIRLLKRVSNDT